MRAPSILPFAAAALMLSGCMATIPGLVPKVKNVEPNLSAKFPYEVKTIEVLDSTMAYVEAGDPKADPILLVHGNPTSSYLWRNVIPGLEGSGRVIAVDLIGMGSSGKPDVEYTLEDHIKYFDAWVAAMDLKDVTLVLHDWGGGIGLNYAMNHEDNVAGIALMEAVTIPFSWAALSPPERTLFKGMRNQKKGDKLLIGKNYFVEKLIPAFSGRDLTEEEMDHYRAPFKEAEHRTPARRWPQEVPFDGVPKANHDRIQANYDKLKETEIPLLILQAEPGAIYNDDVVALFKKDLPEAKFAKIGSGLHYVQETQPSNISKEVAAWLADLDAPPSDKSASSE